MSDLRGPMTSRLSLSLSYSFSVQFILWIFQAFCRFAKGPLAGNLTPTCHLSLHLKHFTHNPPMGHISWPPSLSLFSSPPFGVELSVDLFLFSIGRKGRDETTRPPSEASLGPDRIRAGLSVSFSAGRPLFKLPSSSSSSFSHCKWGHLFCSIQADSQRCSKPTSHYLAFPSLCFVSLRGCPLVPLSLPLTLSLHKWFPMLPQLGSEIINKENQM